MENRRISIEDYKKILVEILKKIDYLCSEHNLNYQLAYGTLLGAVRHGGFIPWDDDVDIFMPREDYIKLQNLIGNGLMGINFISIDNEPNTIYPFGKICDVNTLLIEHGFRRVPGYGAYVDVFPLDYVPEDEKKRQRIFKKYNTLIKLIQHSSRTSYTRVNSEFRNIEKFLAFKIGHCFDTKKLVKKVDKELQNLSNKEKTSFVSVPWDSYGEAFNINDIYNVKKIKFEDTMLNVSINYDAILNKIYGEYMKLPPESERVNKHNLECYYLDD